MVITLLVLGLVAASAAFAGNLVTEGFTYANGNLVPNNPGAPATGPWAAYSGTTSGDIQIASNVATGQMNVSTFAKDDAVPFTPATLLVPTYACFDVLIPCFTGNALPAYFAGLKDAGTANMVARVYVLGTSASTWTFGISHGSTNRTALGVTPWGPSMTCNTWYRIVIKYDPVAKSSTMWVNPTNEFSTSVTDAVASSTSLAAATFFLRQGASSSFYPNGVYTGTDLWVWQVDNVGVGTTFGDACNEGVTSTSNSTWGKLKALYR